MTTINLGWLPDLLSNIPYEDGNAREQRRAWNFVGFELADDPANGWLTITVTGADDLEAEFLKVTTPELVSPPNEILTLDTGDGSGAAYTFKVAAVDALYLGDASGETVMTVPAARDGFRLSWTGPAASGAGAGTYIDGQDGAAGDEGGEVKIRTGNGGAGGLVGGHLTLDVCEDDGGNVSAECRITAGAQRLVTVAERAASLVQMDFGSNATPIAARLRATEFQLVSTGLGIERVIPQAARDVTTWGVAGNPEQVIRTYREATTTDATPLEVALYEPPDDRVVHASVIVVAYHTNGDVASYEFRGTFRKAADVVALVATTSKIHESEDTAGWAATLAAGTGGNADEIAATLTGLAATNITWKIYSTFHIGGA